MGQQITVYSSDPTYAGSTTITTSGYFGNSNHANVEAYWEATDSNYNDMSIFLSISMGSSSSGRVSGIGDISASINNAPTNSQCKTTFGINSGIGNYVKGRVIYIFNTSSINGGSISLDTSYSKTIGIEEYVYYSYTAQYSGSYTFTFTANSNLKGWISTNTNDNSGSGNTQGTITQTLNAGTTYYFCVKNTSSKYQSGITTSIKVTYTPPDTKIYYHSGNGALAKIHSGASFNLDTMRSIGFEKTGWSFIGWNTYFNTTEVQYTDGASYTGTLGGEVHLYAIWKKNISASVTYDINNNKTNYLDGELYSYNTSNNSFKDETSYTTRLPTYRDDFTYDTRIFSPINWGKYLDGKYTFFNQGASISISGGEQYYLQYSNNTLTLSYDKNNEAAEGETPSLTNSQNYINNTFEEVEFIVSESLFTLSNFNFDSWNTAADETGKAYPSKSKIKISSNTTLYAIWKKLAKGLPIYYKNMPIVAYLRKNNKYYEIILGEYKR